MADEEGWASLGVRPSRYLGSEASQLELSPVDTETLRDRAARERLQATRGDAAAAAAAGGRSAGDAVGAKGASSGDAEKTSASEEIFERHGWNEVKSGWSGLGF